MLNFAMLSIMLPLKRAITLGPWCYYFLAEGFNKLVHLSLPFLASLMLASRDRSIHE
jgi:hypothetical protein